MTISVYRAENKKRRPCTSPLAGDQGRVQQLTGSVSPAGNRCHFVLLDKDESCPTADLSNIRPSQWSGLFDRWAVEHAPELPMIMSLGLGEVVCLQASSAVFERRAAAECTSGRNGDVTGRFGCSGGHVCVAVAVMVMVRMVLVAWRCLAGRLRRRSGGQHVAATHVVPVGTLRREFTTARTAAVRPRHGYRLLARILRRSGRFTCRTASSTRRGRRLRGRRPSRYGYVTAPTLRDNRHNRINNDESLWGENWWSTCLELVQISAAASVLTSSELYRDMARSSAWTAVDESLQTIKWVFRAQCLSVNQSLQRLQWRQSAWRRRRPIIISLIQVGVLPYLLAVFRSSLCIRTSWTLHVGRPTFHGFVCRGFVTDSQALFKTWRRVHFLLDDVVVVVLSGSGEGRRVSVWKDWRRSLRRRRKIFVIVDVVLGYTEQCASATGGLGAGGGRRRAVNGGTERAASVPARANRVSTLCLFVAPRRHWLATTSGRHGTRRLTTRLFQRWRTTEVALNQRLHRLNSRFSSSFTNQHRTRRLALPLWIQQSTTLKLKFALR